MFIYTSIRDAYGYVIHACLTFSVKALAIIKYASTCMCIAWQPESLIYKYMYNQSVRGMFATEMILNINVLKS